MQTQPIGRAGLPTTSWNGLTSRVTTDPVPTMQNWPSSTPGPIVAFAPTVTPCLTVVDSVSSVGSDVMSARVSGSAARGNVSFVNTTCAANMTMSSMVTLAQI